ncbi:endonuclease MutS2 [Peptoniphilus equinus]|uniref:Endonuclease MutS2 n=1 Tax=Peptoniphilus equinus TaxID=3016343 RepID=A0ABY7QUJ6_9FIRM|nr:endonuclease MutS2 [Peptoniphilus equinus]WBW50397.1 endonuclease MutS2 [Peptoniphilus equinus]
MTQQTKSQQLLELNKIIERLQTFASSAFTATYMDTVEIATDQREVARRLQETDDAVAYIMKKSEPPLFGIHDLGIQMKRLEIGGYLSAGELLKVGDFLRGARYLRNYLTPDLEGLEATHLKDYKDELAVNRALEETIENAIVSEDEISDNASRTLRDLRRAMAKKKDDIRMKLSAFTSSGSDYLQDAIVTIRDGRYVVPVKNEHKNKVKGIVHDMSSSGQTVYIEPMSVVTINNELRELEVKEREEIERILQEISADVERMRHDILFNQELLRELDFIFAKGKLSLDMDGRAPKVNSKGYLKFIGARHPLLDPKKVVPIDVELGGDFTSLIITGPNTGGKTVSIKTVGLLTLMAQYGLHIPVDAGSEVAVFDRIFADIGDEQSIEQSLSTFSSHMINIVDILKHITPKSLVIFDELGAGTDPTEGAALARSIMDFILQRKIRAIATTHYTQLKLYALTTSGVQNASMEFDVNTLSPTYHLLIGVAGKSNAFAISEKLGLPEIIIERAKTLLSGESIEFEDVMASIESDRIEIRHLKEALMDEQKDLRAQNAALKQQVEKMERQRDSVMEQAREQAQRLVRDTKENMALVMDELSELRESLTSAQARKLQEAQDLFRDTADKSWKTKGFKLEEADTKIDNLKVGETVRAVSLNTEGTVLELPDNKNQVLVQMGVMKMKLPLDTLERIGPTAFRSKTGTRKIKETKTKNFKTEIDLRGNNFEDAKERIDKYMDDALLAGMTEVRIITGKGTGVLRQKVREYLRVHPHVKHYEDAPQNQGGFGATVVQFK